VRGEIWAWGEWLQNRGLGSKGGEVLPLPSVHDGVDMSRRRPRQRLSTDARCRRTRRRRCAVPRIALRPECYAPPACYRHRYDGIVRVGGGGTVRLDFPPSSPPSLHSSYSSLVALFLILEPCRRCRSSSSPTIRRPPPPSQSPSRSLPRPSSFDCCVLVFSLSAAPPIVRWGRATDPIFLPHLRLFLHCRLTSQSRHPIRRQTAGDDKGRGASR
jgi:hypothetical protein